MPALPSSWNPPGPATGLAAAAHRDELVAFAAGLALGDLPRDVLGRGTAFLFARLLARLLVAAAEGPPRGSAAFVTTAGRLLVAAAEGPPGRPTAFVTTAGRLLVAAAEGPPGRPAAFVTAGRLLARCLFAAPAPAASAAATERPPRGSAGVAARCFLCRCLLAAAGTAAAAAATGPLGAAATAGGCRFGGRFFA